MYKAIEIAYWFLYRNYTERREKTATNSEYDVYEGLTHLKLQQLLYNAQGVNLALKNEKLFEEDIEASDDGPIITSVYDSFHLYHGSFIIIQKTKESEEAFYKIENDTKTRDLLEAVYENFSIYTAWQLLKLSMWKGSPWSNTERHKVIELNTMKEHFKNEILDEQNCEI